MKRVWSPGKAIWSFVTLFALLSAASLTLAFRGHALLLNENQVLYLFSTSAQVIAGIYGLTLTGFIFFRNELSREEFEDETLTDAVEALKKRYFTLLMFITGLVLLSILLANLAITYEAAGAIHQNTVLINVGQSAFITSLVAVAYFIFDVISPQRIEIASRALQDKVDPQPTEQKKGSLEEFLKNYNQIELLLTEFGRPYQEVSAISYEQKYPRRFSNARLAEILLRSERIDHGLFRRIRELITLRNSIIHGAEPVVSNELVQTSATVRRELEEALTPFVHNES